MNKQLLVVAVYVLGFLSSTPGSPQDDMHGRIVSTVLSRDGAWCWFQDPRAVYIDGDRERTYAGWITRDGRLQVGAYDHDDGSVETFMLKESWGADDHNVNSFLVLPDRRIMVFYTRHHGLGLYSRTTVHPEDISQWQDEVVVSAKEGITYSHPVYLEDEGRYYVFWRAGNWKPTYSTSRDGRTWSEPVTLIQDIGREHHRIRPYLKLISDGISQIHFVFTDGHPRSEAHNSVYYMKYEKGGFYNAKGDVIGGLDQLPIPHRKADLVYDAKKTGARAWIWDIALDERGIPVIAYTRLPAEDDHRYHYVTRDGDSWIDNEVVPAGGWMPQTLPGKVEREPHYSGGLVINKADPGVVYLSREVSDVFEIEKWRTHDDGRTWKTTPLTRNSSHGNVRPVYPYGYRGTADHFLWMFGQYTTYKNFATGIMVTVP